MDFGTDRMIALKDGAVGWIVFNNPARHNAVSLDRWRALGRIVDSFASDPAIRVVVVRGAGERAFVSGADISEFDEKRATPAQIETYDTASEESCRK
ncbi:MAG: enoyl-CoA hydratase/isomerase family protein, partial [Microvirga sp.]